MTEQEARCVCGHVEHDYELGECYTSGCKCREFVLRADQDVRDEIAQVLRDATDNGADRTDDYAEAILEWMRERGYGKHPEPEWEYGIRAEGDDEPWSDHSDDLDWLLDITSDYMGLSDVVVRRCKAGPWEPVS